MQTAMQVDAALRHTGGTLVNPTDSLKPYHVLVLGTVTLHFNRMLRRTVALLNVNVSRHTSAFDDMAFDIRQLIVWHRTPLLLTDFICCQVYRSFFKCLLRCSLTYDYGNWTRNCDEGTQ